MRYTPTSENLLLRALRGKPNAPFTHVTFEVGEQLWTAESPYSHLLFPVRGVISLQLASDGGKRVEVALVGPEGYAEVPFLLGADETHSVAVALTAGEAMLMQPQVFREHLNNAGFRAAVEHYARMYLVMVNRVAVCNRLHVMDKTLIARLLLLQDRTRADYFHISQEFFSRTLGVRKATISRAATNLQRMGAIAYDRRGRVTILDRRQLEREACSCYHAIKKESDRLIAALGGN